MKKVIFVSLLAVLLSGCRTWQESVKAPEFIARPSKVFIKINGSLVFPTATYTKEIVQNFEKTLETGLKSRQIQVKTNGYNPLSLISDADIETLQRNFSPELVLRVDIKNIEMDTWNVEATGFSPYFPDKIVWKCVVTRSGWGMISKREARLCAERILRKMGEDGLI